MFNKIQKFLTLIVFVLSLMLLFSAFLNVLAVNDNSLMTGITAVFGGNIAAVALFVSADINFSFLNLLAFFLPTIIAVVIVIYSLKNPDVNSKKIFLALLMVSVFVLSVILISTIATNTSGTINVFSIETTINYQSASLALGSILALIFSILGSITSALYFVLQFSEK